MGRNRGFHLIFISPSRTCLPIHSKKQDGGASLHQEDRPGFGCAEREWTKQEQAEDPVQQNRAGLCRALAARVCGNAVRAHEIESTQFEELLPLGHEAEIVDPELTTDRTAFRQAPDTQHQQFAIVSRW